MSYVAFTFWLVATALDAKVLPANSVPVELELNSPMFDTLAVAVTKLLADEKVPVKRIVLLDELVAAVTACLFCTSPASVVSEAAGTPPVPNAKCDTCLEPDTAPKALHR